MRARLRLAFVIAAASGSLVGCGDDDDDTPDASLLPDAAADAATDAATADAGLDVYAKLTGAIEAELAAQGTYSAAVAVVEDGVVTYARGFGSKRPGDPDPVLPTTRFRIASLSKMMTAVAVLQQAQAGTLDLSAPVTEIFPEMGVAGGAEWLPDLTTHHLLTHSSGMVRVYDTGIACPADDTALACWATSDGFASHVWLMFPPGRMWSYSNAGYWLLGYLVERASGTTFAPYMREHVFEPLGMTRTTYSPAEVLADGDYSCRDPFDLGITSYGEPWRRPGGGAFSTVLDLAAFARFLMVGDESILGQSLFSEMTSPQVDSDWTLDHEQYGYGIFVADGVAVEDFTDYGFTTLAHDGWLPDRYTSYLLVIPSRGFAFVFLASGNAWLGDSLDVALHDVLGLPELPPIDLSEDPADFGRYAGEYAYWSPAGTAILTIALHGETLTATGLLECDLVPERVQNFSCGQERLTFVLDASETAEYVRTNSFVARRVDP